LQPAGDKPQLMRPVIVDIQDITLKLPIATKCLHSMRNANRTPKRFSFATK